MQINSSTTRRSGAVSKTPVILAGGVMGLVTQGKGFPNPATRLVGVLVDRINCLHVGSNTLAKHSAFMTRALSAAEYNKCQKECGFICHK